MNQTTKNDIYGKRKSYTYARETKNLAEWDTTPKNKALIQEFQQHIFATGSKELRVAKLSTQLRYVCLYLKEITGKDIDLDKVTKSEIISLIAHIRQQKNHSEATKSDYYRTIKQFYKWYKEEDNRVYSKDDDERINTKKLYDTIEKTSTNWKRLEADPKTIITDEEIDQVMEKGCNNVMEKAFITMLHETGARISEFLNLHIGDCKLLDNYLEVKLPNEKTTARSVFLIKSIPYYLRWLDMHPYKRDQTAYLWISQNPRNKNQPMNHIGSQKLIDRCFQRTNITKKHNLHWFRHSRATILAPKVTTPTLCRLMGWTLNSKQIKTYCHLSNDDVRDVILKVHGLQEQSKKEEPIRCVCGTLNSAIERYCFKCHKPLKMETIVQDQELTNSEIGKTMEFFMSMVQNPAMMRKFEEFKKELNGGKQNE